MRFSLVAGLVATLALAHQATANITGFSAPSYPIKEGETFNVTFTTKNSLTNNQQYYALFGLTEKLYANTIGSQPFANVDITNYQKITKTYSFDVPITMGTVYGDDTEQTLATAVFGQVGASGGITLQYFNTTINVVPSSS